MTQPAPPEGIKVNLHQLLKAMIEKGASDLHITTGTPPQLRIDAVNAQGETPLMIAAFNKQYEALEYLCKKGADVNARNDRGATALITAAYYNHVDTAKALLKCNADRTIKDFYGNTALYYAESYSYTEMIALLKTP